MTGMGDGVVAAVCGCRTVGTVCAVGRLAGQLREGDDCGAERKAGGDPQRAVHRVDECGAGDGMRSASAWAPRCWLVWMAAPTLLTSMLRSVPVRFGNWSSSLCIDVA